MAETHQRLVRRIYRCRSFDFGTSCTLGAEYPFFSWGFVQHADRLGFGVVIVAGLWPGCGRSAHQWIPGDERGVDRRGLLFARLRLVMTCSERRPDAPELTEDSDRF